MGRSRARMFGAADAVEQPPRRAREMAGWRLNFDSSPVGKSSPGTNTHLHMTARRSQVLAACELAREVELAAYIIHVFQTYLRVTI